MLRTFSTSFALLSIGVLSVDENSRDPGECVMCSAVIPACDAGCADCVVVHQTCDECSTARCADGNHVPGVSAGLVEALAMAGYSMNGTRRRQETTDSYPSVIVSKYTQFVSNGDGYDFHTDKVRTSALEPFQGEPYTSGVSRSAKYSKYVVASASEYSSSMQASASVEARYETVSASVETSFERGVKYSSKDALFLVHGSKDLGFSGWRSSDVPRMTGFALNILCPYGTSGSAAQRQKFEQIFGTHFYIGEQLGTTLDITIHTTTKTSSSSNKVSASVSASFQEFVVEGGASASFSDAISSDDSFSKISVKAESTGTDASFLPTASLDNLQDTVQRYADASQHGAGVARVLRSYEQHPDYIMAVLRCVDKGKALVSANRDYLEKIVSVAVQAKLMADDILARVGEERADGCVKDLSRQAFDLYDELRVYTDADVSLDSYFDADERMRVLYEKWDKDVNRCRDHVQDLSCIETDWDYTGNDINENKPFTTYSAKECQRRCLQVDNCRWWSWTTPSYDGFTNACYIKTSMWGRKKKSNVVSGARDCKNMNTCYSLRVDYNGNDIGQFNGVSSAYECQVLCATHDNGACKYFTWSAWTGDCYIKDSNAGNRQADEWISGPASCGNYCPLGFDKFGSLKKCTKPGLCCTKRADSTNLEEEETNRLICRAAGGEWVRLDYSQYPYTCWLPERSVEVVIGSNYDGTQSQTTTVEYDDLVCPEEVNDHNWIGTWNYPDHFAITVRGREVTATRIGVAGWGVDLRFLCYRPAFHTPSSPPTIPINPTPVVMPTPEPAPKPVVNPTPEPAPTPVVTPTPEPASSAYCTFMPTCDGRVAPGWCGESKENCLGCSALWCNGRRRVSSSTSKPRNPSSKLTVLRPLRVIDGPLAGKPCNESEPTA